MWGGGGQLPCSPSWKATLHWLIFFLACRVLTLLPPTVEQERCYLGQAADIFSQCGNVQTVSNVRIIANCTMPSFGAYLMKTFLLDFSLRHFAATKRVLKLQLGSSWSVAMMSLALVSKQAVAKLLTITLLNCLQCVDQQTQIQVDPVWQLLATPCLFCSLQLYSQCSTKGPSLNYNFLYYYSKRFVHCQL